jgi:hypothetical protein
MRSFSGAASVSQGEDLNVDQDAAVEQFCIHEMISVLEDMDALSDRYCTS